MTVVDFFIIKFIHLYNVRPMHIPSIANQIKKSSCPKTNHNSWCQHGDPLMRNWCHPSNPRWTSTALRSVGSPLPRCRCAWNVARILPFCYRWVNIMWISLNNISFKQNTARWANSASTFCSQMQKVPLGYDTKIQAPNCFLVTNSNFP